MKYANARTSPLSRRGFLREALLSTTALSLSARWALAEALVTGKPPKTAADIQGAGVPKGIVQLGGNENPLGASPLAIQAVSQHLLEMNRYDFRPKLPFLLHKLHNISLGEMNMDFENIDFSNPATIRALMASRSQMRIIVAPGSTLLLHAIAMLAMGDGTGEVIEAVNGYDNVARTAEQFQKAGAKTNAIRVPLTSDYKHDLEAMRQAITLKTTSVSSSPTRITPPARSWPMTSW